MSDDGGVVLVVDDDASVRQALERLVASAGYVVESFASATDLMARGRPSSPCCLVLDVRLPGVTGLDLQQNLADAGIRVPIVFITGYGDMPTSVRAMKAGAVDFLAKPFDQEELLAAVGRAVAQDLGQINQSRQINELRQKYELLTDREKQVFRLVTEGMLNKQIGTHLGVTEKTIKVHRARVMDKMGAASLADLVRMAGVLGTGTDQV